MPGLSRSALLTIDVQGDFYNSDAPALIEGTRERLPEMQNVVQAFRSTGRPIVHVVRLYLADGSNAEPVRRPLLSTTSVVRPGTAGSELAPELLPQDTKHLDPDLLLAGDFQSVGPSEWIMYKPRWGAFYRTKLEDLLRDLDVHTVVLVGCNFANCPRTTLYEASERDFDTVLVSDAVSGAYERGLQEVGAIGAVVMTAREISDLVTSQPST